MITHDDNGIIDPDLLDDIYVKPVPVASFTVQMHIVSVEDYVPKIYPEDIFDIDDDEATADQLQPQRLSADPMWQNLMQQL